MQLPQMMPGEEVHTDDEPTALPPFNPLQSSHDHMYSSKHSKWRKEGENETKAKRRASRQILPTAKPTESTADPGNVKRRGSRLGMFGFLNRQKPLDFDLQEPRLEAPTEENEDIELHVSGAAPVQPDYTAHAEEPQAVEGQTPQKGDSLRHRASKRALKTKESFTRQRAVAWQPPPLFQVYPQSVKHATLNTPSMPAESLIRISQERQQKSSELEESEAIKKPKDRKLRKSSAYELSSSRDWTLKVFALVTEGYLLQYNGRGNHDRLPEKILPLCKDSAAFATDAIQGKPFVLQISQMYGEDGSLNTEISKEILKRQNLKHEMKRSSSALLLVLDNPVDMNAWLVSVRKAIEVLGGKHYKEEVFGTDGLGAEETEGDEDTPGLHRMPSQRYLVKRDPNRFSQKPSENLNLPVEMGRTTECGRGQLSKGNLQPTNRYSMATIDSTASRYMSDTTASIDQVQLDRLRESPRQSYASVDAKTASTSRCSSLDRQTTEKASFIQDRKGSEADFTAHSKPKGKFIHGDGSSEVNRESQQATPTPSSDGTTIRMASPTPPNFSVPSFSKRFSITATNPISTGTPRRGSQQSNGPASPISQHDSRPKSSSSSSKRYSVATQGSGRLPTPPQQTEGLSRPHSSGNDLPYSKRNSSLNYARGISPVALPSHSPSPHPPPTTALPPIPTPSPPSAALAPLPRPPPPTTALPSAPSKPPFSPPQTALPPLPTEARRLSNLPKAKPEAERKSIEILPSKGTEAIVTPPLVRAGAKAKRPVSGQVVCRPPTPPNANHAAPASAGRLFIPPAEDTKDKELTSSARKSSRPAPSVPPPPPPTHTLARKSMPRIGREPPPIPPYEKPIISVIPTVEGPGEVAPHPYIPPIRLSERRSGGSLDGPWNAEYSAPKRAFLDLTTW